MKREQHIQDMQTKAAEEAARMPDKATLENQAIQQKATQLGRHVVDIQPDGHCLYNAICDQLIAVDAKHTYSMMELRRAVAEEMRRRRQEYQPFMFDEEACEMMDDAGYTRYCDELERSAVWGGHVEIMAMANVLRRRICVVQSEQDVMRIEPAEGEAEPGDIWVSYHQHQYGLGAHYNSLPMQ